MASCDSSPAVRAFTEAARRREALLALDLTEAQVAYARTMPPSAGSADRTEAQKVLNEARLDEARAELRSFLADV